MIKAVIFDMDGVIVDSEPTYMDIDMLIFKELNIDIDKEEKKTFIGKNSFDMWTEICDKYGLENKYTVKELIKYQRKMYLENLKSSEKLNIMNGVIAWMKYFSDNDIKMVIASSSPKEIIEFVIERFELGDHIEAYVDGDSVRKGKPDPEIFLKAVDELGLKSEECIVIEDSCNGVRAAKAAGIKCIGFKNESSYNQDLSAADFIIASYNDESLDKVINLL
ncbi:HAD family hydrolase [Wukongibacter sp. M2B1]|uniref:HAD family hydrolase n=1 Tax=Wukongibacter sp. M2B1 TaxID=3088895 RepID=UPI003D793BAE